MSTPELTPIHDLPWSTICQSLPESTLFLSQGLWIWPLQFYIKKSQLLYVLAWRRQQTASLNVPGEDFTKQNRMQDSEPTQMTTDSTD